MKLTEQHRYDFFLSDALWDMVGQATRAMEITKADFARLAIRRLLQTEGFIRQGESDAAELALKPRDARAVQTRRQYREPTE
jgi:hypothetical protein